MNSKDLQRKTFLLLLAGVTLAFLAILWPFYGAVFWGVVLTIVFAPLHRRIVARMPQRPTLAALATLGLCLLIVILPTALVAVSLVQEAATVYARLKSGEIDMGAYFQQIVAALPSWLVGQLERLGITSIASLQQKLSAIAVQGGQVLATQAFNIGQNTFQFLVGFCIMLYLLFFLLRDGMALVALILHAVPLDDMHKRALGAKFATVIRATVKGNIAVAATQGLIGGLTFWALGIEAPLLWGVLMAFLSLLPAVGAGLIWGPVAVYFLATGALVQGIVLIAVGVGVIGLVDNILRPILVGKDTRMPDYVVLISTLGGMAMFGLNGFVIGPVIAALFIAAWDIFANSSHEAEPPAR
ncbi:AI-2E family transporter [Ramlibacter sp. H39-3-26]|uniref:AI-2E family transporter n=1 Tax=Curvibacter soli TaxID=3031331 RepID=UPI0023DCA418|nr:AI-2E family transporter [Ramlibacter sp. H39-3-26]MDF1485498.1 AI-2E family transporter [Ramlibacter sp. H39-3-26]